MLQETPTSPPSSVSMTPNGAEPSLLLLSFLTAAALLKALSSSSSSETAVFAFMKDGTLPKKFLTLADSCSPNIG
jgi:hypothetical protein